MTSSIFSLRNVFVLCSPSTQDGIHDVALAAAIWADDGRHAVGKFETCFGERLKPHHLKRLEVHALLLW